MRDCETCVHARPFGGEYDNRCGLWECEYINRDEAIEAYKREGEVVRCKDCKHGNYEFVDNKDWIYCKHHFDYWTADDYCSYGERKESKCDE